jgi:8-oxo-dGTP diphosphatase
VAETEPGGWEPPSIDWAAPDDVPAEAGPKPPATGVVRAAGGVVWTRWGDNRLRILLIHRPRYDDWSLPKGKVDPGESDTDCAVREVWEETGLRCTLGEELPGTSYRDRHGRPKTVRYFAMQPVGGSFTPHDEVDEIRWVDVDEADRLLSYEHDAAVVAAFIGRLTNPG